MGVLNGEFDATVWAKEFMCIYKTKNNKWLDEDLMLTWFTNAIMSGYDYARRYLPNEKNCNHIIGLSTPRFKEHKFIYASDGDKWRGSVCWYCPHCGKRLWDWVEKYSERLGNYKIKKYIGNED